jgi:hypothetical protein
VQRTHWPAPLILEALSLAADGMSDSQIERQIGIPAHTVRTYRRRPPRRARRLRDGEGWCARCGQAAHDFASLDPSAYSYLLGSYLGDGCLGGRRRSLQLRIACDAQYPGLIDEISATIEAVRGRRPALAGPKNGCITVVSGWTQWACYLPQHGPGRKHDRVIELAPWQAKHVSRSPKAFLRGLIHSDGCRCMNRFQTRLPSGRLATYEYPRYFFSNRSPDILGLFADTCDLLGIRWSQSNHRNISIADRKSVARLDEFIGPKA